MCIKPKDKFNIFASADFDTAYAQAAEAAIHPKGFAAFRKYAFNNLRTLQINGILSAPSTHITNGLSGVTNALLNPLTKLVAGKMFNDQTLTNAAADMLTGYMRSWKESLELGLKVFKSEEIITCAFSKFRADKYTFFFGSLKTIIDFLSDILRFFNTSM